jgi:hypothetical protein
MPKVIGVPSGSVFGVAVLARSIDCLSSTC